MNSRSTRCLTGVALLACVGGCGWADGAYFQPDRRDHGGLDGPHREVWFAAPDGPILHGVWLETRGRPRGTVVYCHGNDRNLTRHASIIGWLADRGYDVLVFDFRGYGRSAGRPSRTGAIADTVAAIDVALRRDPTRTVVYGRSLGGAFAAVAVAARPQVRALVLESAPAGFRSVAAGRFPGLAVLVPLFVSEGPDPQAAVARLDGLPTFVAAALDDPIVPFRESLRLFAAHPGPKTLWIESAATHASPAGYDPLGYRGAVSRFLDGALAR